MAESKDGIVWRRENQGRPVKGLSPAQAYGQTVCRRGKEYLMLYMALEAEPGLYAAVSSDGFRWRMLNQGRPVLAPGRVGELDDAIVGHACMLFSEGRILTWYTGYRKEPGGIRGWRLRIGLAEGVQQLSCPAAGVSAGAKIGLKSSWISSRR